MANGTALSTGVRGTAKTGNPALLGSYSVLKLTPTHVVLAFRGDVLDETVALTRLATQYGTPTTPVVDIKALWWSGCDAGEGHITRNSVKVWSFSDAPLHFQFDGWTENQERTSDIQVVFTGNNRNSTLVLELVKKGGYGDEQYRALA
jgi:hypothetical protein